MARSLKRLLLLSIQCLLFVKFGYTQTESVYLHTDKTVCYPADTIWFRAYIMGHVKSTNLYVELYDEKNKLVNRRLFPVLTRTCLGQLVMPKKAGLYWLRNYTRNSQLALQSLTVRDTATNLVIRKMKANMPAMVTTDTAGVEVKSRLIGKYLSLSVVVNARSPMAGKTVKLEYEYEGKPAGIYDLILQKDTALVKNIPLDDLHGYLGLFLYYQGNPFIRQLVALPEMPSPVTLQSVDGKFTIINTDTASCNYLLSIVRSDQPSAGPIHEANIGKELKTDTNGLSFNGIIRVRSGKPDKMIVMLKNGPVGNNTQIIQIDSSRRFSLNGLAFTDTAMLFYSVMGRKVKDFQISIDKSSYPNFFPPPAGSYEYDTLQMQTVKADSVHFLKTVYVRSKRTNKFRILDQKYTSGMFIRPAFFSFNLLDTARYPVRNYGGILNFLDRNLPGFLYVTRADTPLYKGKPVYYYLDEQLVDYKQIADLPYLDIAYIKVIDDFILDDALNRQLAGIAADAAPKLNNAGGKIIFDPGKDNKPRAMIAIYRRKNEDMASLPAANMKKILIKGYDPSFIWSHPDRSTVLWAPIIVRKTYNFQLPHGTFRVTVNGIKNNGQYFSFEKIISN